MFAIPFGCACCMRVRRTVEQGFGDSRRLDFSVSSCTYGSHRPCLIEGNATGSGRRWFHAILPI